MDEQDKMDDALLGKTITGFEWADKEDFWPGNGFTLTFSDGSMFCAYENGQAGEIRYNIREKDQDNAGT